MISGDRVRYGREAVQSFHMDIPDYDNAAKWGGLAKSGWRNRKVRWLFIYPTGCLMIILGAWLLKSRYSVVELQDDLRLLRNQDLKRQQALQDALDSVQRYEKTNSSLVAENLHFKSLTDEIKRIYPGLDQAAALAKVIEDLKRIEAISTSGAFQPFSSTLTDLVSTQLINLRLMNANFQLVDIMVENGNMNRARLANELAEIMRSCGWKCTITPWTTFMAGGPADPADITYHASEADLWKVNLVHAVLTNMISARVDASRSKSTNSLAIHIRGEPIFRTNGFAVFK